MPAMASGRVAASPLPREEQAKPQSSTADASWACQMRGQGAGGRLAGGKANRCNQEPGVEGSWKQPRCSSRWPAGSRHMQACRLASSNS